MTQIEECAGQRKTFEDRLRLEILHQQENFQFELFLSAMKSRIHRIQKRRYFAIATGWCPGCKVDRIYRTKRSRLYLHKDGILYQCDRSVPGSGWNVTYLRFIIWPKPNGLLDSSEIVEENDSYTPSQHNERLRFRRRGMSVGYHVRSWLHRNEKSLTRIRVIRVDIVMLTQTGIFDRSIAEIVEFSSSVE
jgi:hypothetical protein